MDGVSEAVIKLLYKSITPGTVKTYKQAVKKYKLFCTARGWSDALCDVSVGSAAEWLASLINSHRLTANTIRTHATALSTMRQLEAPGAAGPNPMRSDTIVRLLNAADMVLVEVAKTVRLERLPEEVLTPQLLETARVPLLHGTERSVGQRKVMWAAANLALHGLLRPNEFVGSAAHPDRALQAEQITFKRGQGKATSVVVYPAPREPCTADRLLLALGPTKADPLGKNPPKVIANPVAVQAVWDWMCMRLELGEASSLLFQAPDERPLTAKLLCRVLAECVFTGSGGLFRPRFVGRSFRRGGASSMMLGGASIPDITGMGTWKTPGMVNVYANEQSREERAVAVQTQLHRRYTAARR